MKIAVCGTGYVGLVAAVAFAAKGHHVVGIDVDEKKVETLSSGRSPLFEPGLEALMQSHRENLSFTLDTAVGYKDADIIFIAVPTPERSDGRANLDFVKTACAQIVASNTQARFVVIKSTVPPGTNDEIQEYFDSITTERERIEVISNPEFLSQGTAVRDMMFPSRIVVGVQSEEAAKLMQELYAAFEAPIYEMGLRSAEMVKYASNDFLALKISYINEIANLCDVLGANVEEVAAAMGADPRIGSAFLRAGIGYGGSCFPKDTKALHWLSACEGREIKTIKAAIDVNKNQRMILLEKAFKDNQDISGSHIAVLGLSFKPGTDDLRDAPSLDIVKSLLERGAKLHLYDPCAIENFKKFFPASDEIFYFDSPRSALEGADFAFLLTEWEEITSLSPEDFLETMSSAELYDGRNMFSIDYFADRGIRYRSIGRPSVGVCVS